MKLVKLALLSVMWIFSNSAFAGNDCEGKASWIPFNDPNYVGGAGVCGFLGRTDPRFSGMTNQDGVGVCLPGARYETFCDDNRDSNNNLSYRTCQGPRRCDGGDVIDRCEPDRGYSRYEWDFERCRPCRFDEYNVDGRGRCELDDEVEECRPDRGYSRYEWDFDRCRPCRTGYYNVDGRGRCELDDMDNSCRPDRGYSKYEWDFDRCRPCRTGWENADGRGSCDTRI